MYLVTVSQQYCTMLATCRLTSHNVGPTDLNSDSSGARGKRERKRKCAGKGKARDLGDIGSTDKSEVNDAEDFGE